MKFNIFISPLECGALNYKLKLHDKDMVILTYWPDKEVIAYKGQFYANCSMKEAWQMADFYAYDAKEKYYELSCD